MTAAAIPQPLRYLRHPLHTLQVARAHREAWRRLFPPGAPLPFDVLPAAAQVDARRMAASILAAHRSYLSEFEAITAKAQETFENRAWTAGVRHAEHRVRLYRSAINRTWAGLQRQTSDLEDRKIWMGARQAFLERVFRDYDADLALTFFYSTMRIAFARQNSPVEYDDDGLTERPHVWRAHPVWRSYRASPARLGRSVERVLAHCGFRTPFEDARRDAGLVAARLLEEWERQTGGGAPRRLLMLKPIFFRDREAYLVGKLCSDRDELPVVLALRHEGPEVTVDAVLAGREDMRNILFVSTRSTFHVNTDDYRETLRFLDTLAPERGYPAMAAVIGFTHPARVELNQRLRRRLVETGERFVFAPGR